MEANYKKANRNLIVSIIIAFSIAISCSGCGARKMTKSSSEESTKTEQKSEEKKDLTVKSENNIHKTTTIDSTGENTVETVTIEPKDNTKPAMVTDEKGNKYDLNNAKYTKKTEKTKSNKAVKEAKTDTSKSELTYKGQLSKNDKSEIYKSTLNKQTTAIHFQWWWILIALGTFFTWQFYKKQWPFNQ